MSKFQITIKDENGMELNSIIIENQDLNKVVNGINALNEIKTVSPKFEMKYVGDRSSNVDSIGWIEGTLFIKFKSGGLYSYENVPHEELDKILAADSIGKYVVSVIRNNYPSKRVS